MIYYILSIIAILSFSQPIQSLGKSKEKTIIMNNKSETITVYLYVRRMLLNGFVRVQNHLLIHDKENFLKITDHINQLLSDPKNNMNPDIIESYVSYVGSSQYLNEYKGLFVYLFQKSLRFSGIPTELMYVLENNDRIVYFEARNLFKDGDKQVFDRGLLKKFKVTKSQIKALYKYSF